MAALDSTVVSLPLPRPTFGEIWRDSWATVQSQAVVFVLVTLIVQTPLDMLVGLIPDDPANPAASLGRQMRMQGLLATWVGVIGNMALMALAAAGRDRVSLGAALGKAWSRYRSGVWGSVIFNFGVGLGLLFLLVPGLVLLVRWACFLPFVVLETKPGWDALRASEALVRGRSWLVLRRLVLIGIIVAGAMFASNFLLAFMLSGYWGDVVMGIPDNLALGFGVIFVTHLYLRLRGEAANEPPVRELVV